MAMKHEKFIISFLRSDLNFEKLNVPTNIISEVILVKAQAESKRLALITGPWRE